MFTCVCKSSGSVSFQDFLDLLSFIFHFLEIKSMLAVVCGRPCVD